MMSGGPIEKFTEGWAVRIFGWGKAHYFKRDGLDFARPICGAPSALPALLRGLGTWKKCARCEGALGRSEKPRYSKSHEGWKSP